jgi:hypothetical protein
MNDFAVGCSVVPGSTEGRRRPRREMGECVNHAAVVSGTARGLVERIGA